jgi:hypothetical protein
MSIHDGSTEEVSSPILKKTALNMLKDQHDIKFISSVTGFSVDQLLKLKNTI